MTNLVEIRDLGVAFDGVPVLHGIDLDVRPGEALGLVGESGCGKSVTWLAALGLLPSKASVTGHVRLGEADLSGEPGVLESGGGKRGEGGRRIGERGKPFEVALRRAAKQHAA